MAKHKRIKPVTSEGWSDWITPIQNYKMTCCDCGLVHDMEWQVLKVTEDNAPDFNADELPWGDYRIALRARRNNRSTGQVRRHDAERAKRREAGDA